MSWTNPYKKRFNNLENSNINVNQNIEAEEKQEQQVEVLDEAKTSSLIDINDLINQSETINVSKENIPVHFESSIITGMPSSITLTSVQLGKVILNYEKDFPNEKMKI